MKDFASTAALIAQVDLVVTVDTSVAHLAASLGKPTHMLVPYMPDWRWGAEGDTTAWYPSMRLCRQERPDDWSTVLRDIEQCLSTNRYHVHAIAQSERQPIKTSLWTRLFARS